MEMIGPLQLLKAKHTLHCYKGKVVQMAGNMIWVRTASGNDIAIVLKDPELSFCVGHELKVVVSKAKQGNLFVKAVNFTTSTEVSMVESTELGDTFNPKSTKGTGGIFLTTIWGLVCVHPIMLFCLLCPFLNMLTGIVVAIAALKMVGSVRHAFKYNVLGWVLLCILANGAIYLFPNPSSFTGLVLLSGIPFFCIVFTLALLLRQMTIDGQDVDTHLDKLLAAV